MIRKLAVLFYECFKLSLVVIGGGYAILIVADETFARRKWTAEGELIAELPVFQMVPGLIATHVAVYVGNKIAGAWGAVLGVVAVALPSICIFLAVSVFYALLPLDHPLISSFFVGLRSALTGIIAAALVRSWRKSLTDVWGYLLFAAALALLSAGVTTWVIIVASILAGEGLVFLGSLRPSEARKDFRSSLLIPFLLFLKYGLLCFGGGFVLVPMYLEDFVGASAKYLRLPEGDFSNLIALTQMTPGPIGVNAATFFGYRLAGVGGSVLASVALLLPGSLLVLLVIRSLDRFRAHPLVIGLRRGVGPASIALISFALFAFARMSFFGATGAFNPIAAVIASIGVIMILKRKIKAVTFILLSAFFALAVRAEDAIDRERYPDADSVIVERDEDCRYALDGTYTVVEDRAVKILTEKGRREESRLVFSYSARYGTGAVERVEIEGTNGVVRAVDVSATMCEATDNSSMDENIFDPLDRVVEVTIPGLLVGETLRTRTRISTFAPRCRDRFADLSVLEWTSPIVRARVTVVAPKARPLKSIALLHPLGNVTSNFTESADGSLVYSWTATNSPQAFPEPDMPSVYTEVQHLRYSTSSSWEDISRWYWELSRPHLVQTTSVMTNLVRELSAAADPVRAIYDWVAQNVRYMGLTMEDTSPGYAPHDVSITFENRYGVCRDKAALLVALLRLAGYEAYPTLIHVSAKHERSVPSPFFNHAIVAVAKDGGYLLMDPTNESSCDYLPAYLSDRSYLVATPEGETLRETPVAPPAANALRVESAGTLAEDGSMFLRSTLAFSGLNDTALRGIFLRSKRDERVRHVERLLRRDNPGAKLLDCEILPEDLRDTSKPLSLKLACTVSDAVIKGRRADELKVPHLGSAFGLLRYILAPAVRLDRRRFSLELASTACTEERVEIALGEGCRVVSVPEAFVSTSAYACATSYSRGAASASGAETVRLLRTCSLGKVRLSPGDYLDLKKTLREQEAADRRSVLLASDDAASADERIFKESVSVDFPEENVFVETNRLSKKILTYAGKKRASELKYPFNPLIEKVKVVSARVTTLDGRTVEVSPREINEMDADWVASAPRYPASRQLIVNLPAVEIGSRIDLAVEKITHDRPDGFAAVFPFDSFESCDEKEVRVGGETRVRRNLRRLRREPMMGEEERWREVWVVTSNACERTHEELVKAAWAEPLIFPEAGKDLRSIRDWMARNVHLAGPGLYELPISAQLTDPATVLRERYASRLDFVRTLAALLKGVGIKCDIVFAADDAKASDEWRRRIRERFELGRFSLALCRVYTGEGTVFLGDENEYTPMGASKLEGATFFAPVSGEFGTVEVRRDLAARRERRVTIELHEDGSAAFRSETLIYGASVGTFRRRHAEMLPEERERLYQAILLGLSKSAVRTEALETDVVAYPARSSFACTIADFAIRTGDLLSLTLPDSGSPIFALTGAQREHPIFVDAAEPETCVYRIEFPRGFSEAEHLPRGYRMADPCGTSAPWYGLNVSTAVEDGRLVVTLRRETFARKAVLVPRDYFPLFKSWAETAGAAAERTVSARLLH